MLERQRISLSRRPPPSSATPRFCGGAAAAGARARSPVDLEKTLAPNPELTVLVKLTAMRLSSTTLRWLCAGATGAGRRARLGEAGYEAPRALSSFVCGGSAAALWDQPAHGLSYKASERAVALQRERARRAGQGSALARPPGAMVFRHAAPRQPPLPAVLRAVEHAVVARHVPA